MKIRSFFLLLFAMLLLTGCTGHNTEEQMMVVVMGIDTTKDHPLQITVKVPSFASSSDSGSASDSYITLSASGKTFPDALSRLSSIAPRSLNFSQTRLLLVQSKALDAFPDLITTISTVDGMRSQAMVSICETEAKQLMQDQKAAIGTRLSRYIDSTLDTALEEGVIPNSTLIRALSQMGGHYQDALLSVYTQDHTSQSNQEPSSTSQQSSKGGASQEEKDQKHNSLWKGAAAMDGRIIAGYLSDFETMLCRFICGEIGSMTYHADNNVYLLTSRFGPHFSIDRKGDRDILRIHGNLNLLPRYGAQPDLPSIQRQLEQDTEKLIRTLQSFGCDALGFGGHYSRQFSTLSGWEESRWKQYYMKADVEIDFDLTLMDE